MFQALLPQPNAPDSGNIALLYKDGQFSIPVSLVLHLYQQP
jgi:hypothetical protein